MMIMTKLKKTNFTGPTPPQTIADRIATTRHPPERKLT
jgi:hypothetical protein